MIKSLLVNVSDG